MVKYLNGPRLLDICPLPAHMINTRAHTLCLAIQSRFNLSTIKISCNLTNYIECIVIQENFSWCIVLAALKFFHFYFCSTYINRCGITVRNAWKHTVQLYLNDLLTNISPKKNYYAQKRTKKWGRFQHPFNFFSVCDKCCAAEGLRFQSRYIHTSLNLLQMLAFFFVVLFHSPGPKYDSIYILREINYAIIK